MLRGAFFAFAAIVLAIPGNAQANTWENVAWTAVEARPPMGYIDFCARNIEDCDVLKNAIPTHVTIDYKKWVDLVETNIKVNHSVAPITDFDLYHEVEYWTYPNGSGDCEDYVLEKLRMLTEEKGWPVGAFHIITVDDELGLVHAILGVDTTTGLLVLDNKWDDILDFSAPNFPHKIRKWSWNKFPSGWARVPTVISSPK